MAASVVQTIDFSNVKEGGNFNRNRIPAGDYLATITKVEDAKSKKDDGFQYLFSIKIDKHSSRTFPFYCKLAENQLWKLRNLLIAAGINVPKKRMKVDPNKAVGRKIGVTIEDAEYDGKEQSEISAVFPAAELQEGNLEVEETEEEEVEEEVEEEEDYATDDEAEEEEEAEDEAADNLDELDRSELKAMLQALNGADWKAKKSQSDDDLRELIRAAVPDEEEPEEEEEEEEEPPAPVAKKTRAAAKPAAKKTKRKAAEVSDDELEELDIDDL